MHNHAALSRKLSAFVSLTVDEIRTLAGTLGRPMVFEARQDLRFEVDGHRVAYLLEEGWAYTYKVLPNGSRQVVDIAVAGDIVGIRGLMLRTVDGAGAMVTPGIVHEVTLSAMEALVHGAPRLAAGLLWACSRDESLVVEHLVDLGRRSAIQRVSHFFLELRDRLDVVGLNGDSGFRCPVSQTLLADALGLTPIHLNRTLRELKRSQLLEWRAGIVRLLEPERLAELAGYDPGYLDHAPVRLRGAGETGDGRGPD